MFSILLTLLVIVAVLMTGLILLQKSEGSGMSGSSAASMFGGVLTGSAAGNFLTKTTAWLATLFFILCALLSLVVAKTNVASKDTQSVGISQELNPQVEEEKEDKSDKPATEPLDMDKLIETVNKSKEDA